MYDHVMVPVDDTVLSIVNAETAIQLAKRLGSRITFFHASADLSQTRAGARLKAEHPRLFAESAFGDAHALLSNYAAGAEAAGVAYDTLTEVCDHPADAIVEAARAHGCDLIVMASRGESGLANWLRGSQMELVLRRSGIPMLVTRMASTEPIHALEQVLAALHEEHQAILAVVLAVEDWVQQAPAQGAAADLLCLESMLEYLQTYALKVHHPKEEQFLYPCLRQRAPQCEEVLNDVARYHLRVQAMLGEALAQLQAVTSEAGADSQSFFSSVLLLTRFVQKMVGLEERTVVPLARQHLQEADWQELRQPYHRHKQLLSGASPLQEAATRQMFTKMSDLHLGVARHDLA